MDCPYCNADLLHLAWKYWAGDREEKFELICPECGNSLAVAASLSFDACKLEDKRNGV
jgi:uncharacterized protein YbaR (Trm112 family)